MTASALFEVAVVGAGLMGSAAARHLADAGLRVALVGPIEPSEKATHSGVFSSHYDQARVTRRIDQNHDWSRLSSHSIDRYHEIETRSGHQFFHASGSVMAGPEAGNGAGFMQSAQAVAREQRIAHIRLRGKALAKQFPYLRFPEGVMALFEPAEAGWINPRDHVRAEIKIAENKGAITYRSEVYTIDEARNCATIVCANGTNVKAERFVVACGAYTGANSLLPNPPALKVFARTVAFFRASASEAKRLAAMPSLVYLPPGQRRDIYVLPPVTYPDGHCYLKIGGNPDDQELTSASEIRDWFKSSGDEGVGRCLADQLARLMPDLCYSSLSFGSCATAFTQSGFPSIQKASDRGYWLTGGNGAGAKCADELGWLCAKLILDGNISDQGYMTNFKTA